ncbi:RHS repeat-associated core domain-containing protein [Sorangium cellulosum]|uniref:RHS repeat-associated core domain-containing protein n=1 Tax=Sorangium cellulosum TaxID=56 RepID=UPI00042316EA|nr:RHS repeat-associated core domain-containing protein [Sorangium cellulosum]
MTYEYCSADAEEGFTAEYAIDEIWYTGFEGEPALAPSRAVRFVYETREPGEVRTHYAGGMALQRSLRLDEIQMLGADDALVRRYGFTYEVSEATKRTLLTQVEECAGVGVCKPPTRFQYSRGEAGFRRVATDIAAPTSRKASPMLFDIDGDGLDDLVVPDVVAGLSTPENPITGWLAARNRGSSGSAAPFAPATLALLEDWAVIANPHGSSDPELLQPELGTAMDFNQDGRTDVFLHDVHDTGNTWLVLLTQPDLTFEVHDTGIRRPFPLGVRPAPPGLRLPEGAVHLADVDGDGVPDLIQCDDHSRTLTQNPLEATWTVHRWKPERDGTPAGFDATGESLEPLNGFPCDMEIQTLDLDADGKVDLVVATVLTFSDGTMLPAPTYGALTRRHDGGWEVFDTELPQPPRGGRTVFLDVNGDGLPDAVQSGFSHGGLRTILNTGPTFDAPAVESLGPAGVLESLGAQDSFFRLAAPLDYDGDGLQDLLMPVPPGMLPGSSLALPSWAILRATGARDGPTFALVDPGIPFEAAVGEAVTLAEPHGPRIGDVDGDGAQDVVLPLGGVFNVFQNLAADRDLLVAVSDGMNAHEPSEAGFVPNVSVAYGHLTDASITDGAAEGAPERESMLYLSRGDAANACEYPRRCAVGPRRVVSGYALNNGADRPRRFEVRYRDGRYHRLGRGFLGFGERVVVEVDTGAATAERYDNVTFDEELEVFPFAGQVKHEWRWAPGLPDQPRPEQIELSFLDVTREMVPTNDGATYFTLPTERRFRRAQGVYPGESGEAPTVEAYVEQVASGGERGVEAAILRDTVAKVTDFDAFGNVRAEEVSTHGVDLTLETTRTFKNDTERWVLGQLQTEEACSAAAGLSQCRLLARTTTIYGEIETESIDSDDGIPDTKLDVAMARDDFGNVTEVTADDAFGHHRAWSTTYDAEGIFPETHVNAADHTTRVTFDEGLGVLVERVDPNGLVTEWRHDGFGRLGLEIRPDETQTAIALSRTKDGGPDRDAWRVVQRTTTTGGADDTVEVDSLGRPIRWFWYGPSVEGAAGGATGEPRRLMQEIAYDARGERVARRSVPVIEGTPDDERLHDVYEHDAVGREVGHITERSYYADKQRLKGVVTRSGATAVQDLGYGYDERLSLTRRTDALQPQHRNERFRYDPLERLTCAYFSDVESDTAPCALRYDHDPNGNLTFAPDAGTLSYDDPLHPHAVTGAGADSFGYDAVGNQIARPGGERVSYTPFDLPRAITQGARTVSFGYDGDQQRIRKTTPDEEMIYFGDLVERVTDAATGRAEHRYYVRSPERVAAIVTRGGQEPGTRYVHVDHLGSVDALTDEDGDVIERRSYDPFGQRRNPVWGEPTPASFASETTRGFTGHEGDDELGLVNMKGRIYDPRLGRFLTTDPIVQAPLSGQSWNPYSYVRNSPLDHVDPSGFQGVSPEAHAPAAQPLAGVLDSEALGLPPIEVEVVAPPDWVVWVDADADADTAGAGVGAMMAPVDVGTTGTSSGFASYLVTASPEHAGAAGPGTLVSQALLGAAEGTRDLGLGIARSLALNALTFGMYGGYELGGAIWAGYEQDGIFGALNAVNPLYHIGLGAADTALEIDGGDYREAGAAGTKAMILAAATVLGMGRGLGALAEESAAAAATKSAVRVTGDALKTARAEFSAAKPKFWQREAAQNTGNYSAENLARMRSGKAPIGSDGYPMELHHRTPLAEGGTNAFDNLTPLTRTEHRLGPNYHKNHPGLP